MKNNSSKLKLIEPGIWKNEQKGNYVVKVSDRSDGKRIQRQSLAKNLFEARATKKHLTEKLSFKIQNDKEMSVGEFESEFMDYLQTTISDATFYRTKGIYHSQIFLPLKDLKFSDLDLRTIEKLVDQQVSHKSAQTRRHFIKYLKKFNNRAIQLGYMKSSIANLLPLPKKQKANLSVLNHDEIVKLLEFLKTNYIDVYYHVAISVYTGIRAGELRALTWKDIDVQKNLISINKTMSRKHGLKPFPKNGENRLVPINPSLNGILEELKSQNFHSPELSILPYWREFCSDEQAKILRMMCIAAGVKEIRWHDLRASFITELIAEGVPLDQVMNIVGHKRISTTDQYFRIGGRGIQGATVNLNFES